MKPRIPQPVPSADVMSLPLNTVEAFVLSRVDGRASLDDIGMMTGVDAARLAPILQRLAELGAVELPWDEGGKAQRAQASAQPSAAPGVPRYDAAELDEVGVEIPYPVRRRILDGYYGLEGKDHYTLLGIAPTADRTEIRTAYFELARVFHPDSQFGKNLGGFKIRMEAVFRRLAEAYETLRRPTRRAEYDEYLALAQRTRSEQASGPPSSRTMRAQKRPSRDLAHSYEKQARYEEKAGNWEAAAESWIRASDARPDDATAARSAAEATLRARGDLRRAQKYAQKAVKLAGADVLNLTVLARVYLEAGLRPQAQRELERAAKLDPHDEMVKNLLREAR
jgi:curved DNA-binding protein CbpA